MMDNGEMESHFIQVSGLFNNGGVDTFSFLDTMGNLHTFDTQEYCKGIPLSEKILLNGGFVADSINYSIGKMYQFHIKGLLIFRVLIAHTGLFYFYTNNGLFPCYRTKYVHSLQNAFKLVTGQKLHIKI